MRIYQDLFTETEIISDSYKFQAICNGAAVEVPSRMVVKGEDNVDVGCGNAFGGKNEEDEEGGQAGGAPVEKVNDLIDAFGYEETSMEKADWGKYIKSFINKVLELKTKNGATAEAIATFKANAGAFVKYIQSKFADLTIYTPKDYDSENSIIYSYWKNQEDTAPVFIFYLDGMKFFKV